jgi:hypothetical protein
MPWRPFLPAPEPISQFGLGWIDAYTAAKGLENCKYPCSASKLEKAVNSLGNFAVPGGFTWSNLSVSATNHDIQPIYGLYGWNPTKKQLVVEPFKVKAGKPAYS